MTVVPGEILTYSGKYVTPLDLQPWQVDITDIAHALSMQCRFSGHVSEFYSVAQHSVLVAQYLANRGASYEVMRLGLLHDAAEAYLQDMARPLKENSKLGEAYRDAEQRAFNAIAAAFDLLYLHHADVKEADLALLALERSHLMPGNGEWGLLEGISLPNDINFEPWPQHIAKARFLEAFDDLFLKEEDVPDETKFEEYDEGGVMFAIHFDDWDALESAIPLQQVLSPQEIDAEIERLHASDVTIDRHPNSERFHELLQLAGETHDRKQADYGRGDDPFANVRASEDWGVRGWVGALIRLNDKVKRLQSLSQKGYLANESAFDSLMDIAVYALIAYVLLEQEQGL